MTLWQWVFVLAVGIVGVGLVVWSVSSRGLHRRKWWQRRRVVVGQRSPGSVEGALNKGLRAAEPLLDANPPSAPRCSSDDWMSDPLTEPISDPLGWAIVQDLVASLHTSPSESLRGSYEVDCPIYAGLAKEFGYDIVRGFDFTTGLVTA